MVLHGKLLWSRLKHSTLLEIRHLCFCFPHSFAMSYTERRFQLGQKWQKRQEGPYHPGGAAQVSSICSLKEQQALLFRETMTQRGQHVRSQQMAHLQRVRLCPSGNNGARHFVLLEQLEQEFVTSFCPRPSQRCSFGFGLVLTEKQRRLFPWHGEAEVD